MIVDDLKEFHKNDIGLSREMGNFTLNDVNIIKINYRLFDDAIKSKLDYYYSLDYIKYPNAVAPFNNLLLYFQDLLVWVVSKVDKTDFQNPFINYKIIVFSVKLRDLGFRPGPLIEFNQSLIDFSIDVNEIKYQGKYMKKTETPNTIMKNVDIIKFAAKQASIGGIDSDIDAFELEKKMVITTIFQIMKSLMLINCSNVQLRTVNPNPIIQRNRRRNNKEPLVSYKEIFIVNTRGSSNIKKEPVYTNAINVCRGHMKIYTKDKPLFGKYTGMWWWQSCVRGDKSKGTINKSYKLKENSI